MPLRPLSDVSSADWFVDSDVPWHVKVGLGPPGFDAYARVFCDFGDDTLEGAHEQLRANVRSILARHTSTDETCYFALWDGWGLLEGGRQDIGLRFALNREASPAEIAVDKALTVKAKARDCAPAFPVDFLHGPKVAVPNRAFYLFEGPLTDDFDRDAADFAPGFPRILPNEPALMWTYDHAWFVAADVDDDWIGVGGSQELIDELLADARFDTEITDYGADEAWIS